jgi:hypothetical protein
MTKLSSQDDELLTKMAEIVFAEVHRDAPISHLSLPRQVFVRVYVAQGIIDNGSLPYFFSSDFPDASDYSVFSEAYRTIGAIDVSVWLEKAVGLFPSPIPHLDSEVRKRYIQENCSEYKGEMCELGDHIIARSNQVFSLLADYVRKHADDFSSD